MLDNAQPLIIDVHVHAIPPELISAINQGRFPNVHAQSSGERWIFSFPGMALSPPSHPAFTQFHLLETLAKKSGIDYQIIGPWTDLFGYSLNPSEGAEWARFYNEALVDACSKQPGMVPIGTIPLQSPNNTLEELQVAHDMGCKGIAIGTDIPGIEIDSPDLEPFWKAVEQLSMPILIHPTFHVIPEKLHRQGLKNTVGRAAETTIALTLLLYSGVLVRHPGLIVIAAHGGGSFVWLLDRIMRNVSLGFAKVEGDLYTSLERLYFDSIVLSPAGLQFLIDRVGVSRILLGSDAPYGWEPDPVGTVRRTNLSECEKDAILGMTASRIFWLPGGGR